MRSLSLKAIGTLCFISIVLCAGIFPAAAAAPFALISPTNNWKYNDQSIQLPGDWFTTGYSETTWSNGLAALGFRARNNPNLSLPPPNVINTLLNAKTPTNAALNIMTFYFRTHFTFTNNPGGMTLTASNLIDDGAIFYLNGRELTRVAMPAGPVFWETTATRGDDIGTSREPTVNTHGYDVFTIPVDALVQGDNVAAVEVHQVTTGSTDMGFQMELWAQYPTPTQLIITNQPQDITVLEGQPVSLSAGVSGDGGHYQWYKGTSPVPGAISDTYNLYSPSTNDSGSYYLVVTNAVNSVTSRTAQVSVLIDTYGPTLSDADGSSSLTNVLVLFSEPVLLSTATNLANYKVTNTLGGTLPVASVAYLNPTNVMLTTSDSRTPNNNYLLFVTGVRDTSPRTNLIAANSFYPIINLATNIIKLDGLGWRYYDPYAPFDEPNLGTAWREIDYTEVGAWGDGAGIFYSGIDSGTIPGCCGTQLGETPDVITYFRYDLSNYQFSPGSNTLFLTHIIDDGAVIYLSGNEILRVNMAAGNVTYTTRASTTVANAPRVGPIPVTAAFLPGKNVLAVELHQSAPSDADKAFALRLDANVRSVAVGPVLIAAGPSDVTVLEGQSATFEVVQVGGSTFQWQLNNANISGANGGAYTTPLATMGMNNAQYRVIVNGSVTSTNARLHVLSDTIAPILLAAHADVNSILVTFSENMGAASANNVANYKVTNSLGQIFSPTSAALNNGNSVLLSFSSLPADVYYVVVNNVRDSSSAGNLVKANSTVRAGFQGQVIDYGDTWRYDQRAIDLSAQGWTARTYNDGVWTGSGPGLLDGKAGGRTASTLPLPVGTVLNPPANNGGTYLTTTYFRKHFSSYGVGVGDITFSTVMDDGAVIYLNGTEITRTRMPAGTVAFATQANGTAVGDATIEGPSTFTVSNLLAGDNVIAVEVHQNGTASSDVTWGGNFSVSTPSAIVIDLPPPPACTNITFAAPSLKYQRASGTNLVLSWINPATNSCGSNAVFTLQQSLSFTNPASATAWSDVTTVSPYTAIGTNRSRFFRLKR